MTAVAGRTAPAPGPVRWAVRAYAPLLVLSIVLAMLVVPWILRTQATTVYESQALVVARQFTLPLAALPRYGEAVFDNGAVAADVGRRFGLSTAGDALIPDKLSVVTGQDSVVMTVTARDDDPELAADIANTAAEAYLDELNRPGPGLAVFVLQSAASPSAEPSSAAPGTAVQLAVGLVAGTLLGLGLIGLTYVLRRPVVDPHDIETVVGAPVLGVVRFPGRTVRDPNAVPGLAPVARALARSGAHDVYVVSPPDRRAQRAAVARMLVEALARWRPAALQTYDATRGGWVRPEDRDLGYAPSLVITDVARPLDAGPDAVDSDTLLVVREGTPERKLWHMMADHADSSYLGVVVVRRTSWLPVRLRPPVPETRQAERGDERPAARSPEPPPTPRDDDTVRAAHAAPPEGPVATAPAAAPTERASAGPVVPPAEADAPATPPATEQVSVPPAPERVPVPATVDVRPGGDDQPGTAAGTRDAAPEHAAEPGGERGEDAVERPDAVAQPSADAVDEAPVRSDADEQRDEGGDAAHPTVTGPEPVAVDRPADSEQTGESGDGEQTGAGEDRSSGGDERPDDGDAVRPSADEPRPAAVTSASGPVGPASLPWQDAALLLGLGTETSSEPADRTRAERGDGVDPAAPGWPGGGHRASPRPGAATGWPGSP